MKGYWPIAHSTLIAVALCSLATLLISLFLTYKIPQKIGRAIAWFLVFFNLSFIHWICLDEPFGIRMLAFCVVLLFAMKAIVLVEEQTPRPQKISLKYWFGFVLAWPGMKSSLFMEPKAEALEGAKSLVISGLIRIFIGLFLIAVAYFSWIYTKSYLLVTLFLLPGISLTVHFGLFNFIAGLWRYQGVDCYPLFQAPLYATSLSEFWSRRWNLAYSEMVHSSVYKPLSNTFGKTFALIASFFFSGLLHEIAISLPVQRGYGLPLLYFFLHGILTRFERFLSSKGKAIDQNKWVGWIWTCFWMLAPLPILFHLPFLEGVVWPIVGI